MMRRAVLRAAAAAVARPLGSGVRGFASSSSSTPVMSKFLGAPSPYVEKLALTLPGSPIPVFRVTTDQGKIIDPHYKIEHSVDDLKKMYKTMIQLNTMDQVFYDAQRQGRISFYMTAFGEEATHIGCASALKNDDVIFAQYREAGILMWRGFTLSNFAHQCFGSHKDLGKGRQMPVHYGTAALHFQTISSPLGTQLPQAVGAAYALKREQQGKIVACFFGEGAASEGDFHAAMNFAATLKVPVMFFCRNNGYAISTPVRDQYAGDGIAARAAGYGMAALRVDGNDLLAVHEATAYARKYIAEKQVPLLVEAMSYRAGHHSTSDDSSRYRGTDEIQTWQTENNPLIRTRQVLQDLHAWDDVQEAETRNEARKEVLAALNEAEVAAKPPVSQLFDDVYAELPHHLRDQKAEWAAHLEKWGAHYNLGEYLPEDQYDNPAKHVPGQQQ